MAKVYDGMADTSVHMLAVAESIEHLSTGEFYFAMDASEATHTAELWGFHADLIRRSLPSYQASLIHLINMELSFERRLGSGPLILSDSSTLPLLSTPVTVSSIPNTSRCWSEALTIASRQGIAFCLGVDSQPTTTYIPIVSGLFKNYGIHPHGRTMGFSASKEYKKELNYYTHVRHTRLMAEGVFG